MSRSFPGVAIVVAALCLSAPALAQVPARVGSEFQVNLVTANEQTTTLQESVDLESNGDFVVVWSSLQQDGNLQGVFGRRFASSGAALAGEFQVNTRTVDGQDDPAVSLDADGDFVVAWSGGAQDGNGEGVFARRFSSTGTALAAEFRVNDFTLGAQNRPVVSRDADGDFVIAWESSGQDGSGQGVFVRRFNSSGAAQAVELQVATRTLNGQAAPAIDLDPSGDFVIAWHGDAQDGDGYGVFGQRFNSLGVKQGPEFQVNVSFSSNQRHPAVGLDADGDFVVSWGSFGGEDGDGYGVLARRFDSTGAPQGTELQVNVYETGAQYQPSLGVDTDGDFIVTWSSNVQDGSGIGVFARRFHASGIPTSGDLPVNTTTGGPQRVAAMRSDADGDFVVVWEAFYQDGAGYGLFGQRFDTPALLDIDADGQLGPLTDGLLVLRFFFGFTGTTLTSGAVGGNCTRCDSAAILEYLQSLT